MVDKIDARSISVIHQVLEATLKELFDELELSFRLEGGTYDGEAYSPKLTIAGCETRFPVDEKKGDWDRYCHIYKMKPEDFGRIFPASSPGLGAGAYRVIGIDVSIGAVETRKTPGGGKENWSPAIIRQHLDMMDEVARELPLDRRNRRP